MRNGTIGKVKEESDRNRSVEALFGVFTLIAMANTCLCTPIYVAIIAYLWAKVGGE